MRLSMRAGITLVLLAWSGAIGNSQETRVPRAVSLLPSQLAEPVPVPDLVFFYTGSNRGYISACG